MILRETHDFKMSLRDKTYNPYDLKQRISFFTNGFMDLEESEVQNSPREKVVDIDKNVFVQERIQLYSILL